MQKQPLLRLAFLLTLFAALPLAGCADVTPAQQAEMDANNDPFEPVNRQAYDTAFFFDRLFFRPVAELYRATVPPPLRHRITALLANMKEPTILANDVLQGDFNKAAITLERFGINTTLGVGGLWDVASGEGLPQQTGDFGQTLAVWGADEGPYLLLPVAGPSSVRDAFGRGVDMALSPWQFLAWMDSPATLVRFEAADYGTSLVVKREKNIEKIDTLRTMLDPYSAIRSAYRQYRAKQLGLPAPDVRSMDDHP